MAPTFNGSPAILYSPAPSEQWVCGNDYELKWTDNDANFPATVRVTARRIDGSIISTNSVPAFVVKTDIDATTGSFTLNVPCADAPAVLPEDGNDEGFFANSNYYLIITDTLVEAGTADAFSIMSSGTVWIKATDSDVILPIEATDPTIWDLYMDAGITPDSFNCDTMENLSWVISTLGTYNLVEGTTLANNETFGCGVWDITWSDMVGTNSSAVLTSKENNIVTTVFRPTYGSGIPNGSDDWSIDFMLDSVICSDVGIYCGENGAKAHKGFVTEYLSHRDEILRVNVEEIENPQEDTCASTPYDSRRLITGMSQGGGLAQIAAVDIAYQLKEKGLLERNPVMLITTGSPPSGDDNFVRAAMELIPEELRERFVSSFTKFDGKEQYIAYKVPMSIPTFFKFTNLDTCMETVPPADAVDYNNYTVGRNASPTTWNSGDLIPAMRMDCRDLIASGTTVKVEWLLDERRTVIINPVFPHLDAVNYDIWPMVSEGIPPPLGGKGPFNVYSNWEVTDPRACDVRDPTDPTKFKSGMGAMVPCHDLVSYAKGISTAVSEVTVAIRNSSAGSCGDSIPTTPVPSSSESSSSSSSSSSSASSSSADTTTTVSGVKGAVVGVIGVVAMLLF